MDGGSRACFPSASRHCALRRVAKTIARAAYRRGSRAALGHQPDEPAAIGAGRRCSGTTASSRLSLRDPKRRSLQKGDRRGRPTHSPQLTTTATNRPESAKAVLTPEKPGKIRFQERIMHHVTTTSVGLIPQDLK